MSILQYTLEMQFRFYFIKFLKNCNCQYNFMTNFDRDGPQWLPYEPQKLNKTACCLSIVEVAKQGTIWLVPPLPAAARWRQWACWNLFSTRAFTSRKPASKAATQMEIGKRTTHMTCLIVLHSTYTRKVAINSTPVSLEYGNSDKSICVQKSIK